MQVSPPAALPVPVAYKSGAAHSRNSYAYATQADHGAPSTSSSASASFSSPSSGPAARSGRPISDFRAPRGIADVLDDTLYTYTGVRSWAAFQDLQREGSGLRQRLQSGAAFEHTALQTVVTAPLVEWAAKLRATQSTRVSSKPSSPTFSTANAPSSHRAFGETAGKPRVATAQKRSPAPPGRLSTAAVAVAAVGSPTTATLSDAPTELEKTLDRIRVGSADVGEDGLLPLWSDLAETQRCGPVVLHRLRSTVRSYLKALLALVTLAERLTGRWGHLSPKEMKEMQTCIAQETKARVPADFIFTVFTELNATEERLGNAVADVAKCTQLEVLRLNRNTALTELATLPPRCRVAMVCGCQLKFFFNSPTVKAAPSPPTFAALTTLGLSYNELRDVTFLRCFPALAVLDVSFNFMSDLEGVVAAVAAHGALTELTLLGNPIALLDVYRRTIVRGCVRLDMLDGVAVTSQERALSMKKLAPGDFATLVEVPEPRAASEDHAEARGGSQPKPTVTLLTLPSVAGSALDSEADGGSGGSSSSSGARTQRQAARQASTAPSTLFDTNAAAAPPPLTDEALRTTVAAEVELLVLRGLRSFEAAVPAHPLDDLMPPSALVDTLAGLDGAAAEGGGPATDDEASGPSRPSAAPPSASPSSPTTRKGKSIAATPASGGAGHAGAGGKRAVAAAAAQSLYELSSRVRIHGCWGGASTSPGAAGEDSPAPLRGLARRPLGPATHGVPVALDLALAAPAAAAAAPPRPGRHGAGPRPDSSMAATKLRQKVASASPPAGGGGAPSPSGTMASATATSSGSGNASNLHGQGAAAPAVGDPFIPSGASADAAAGKHGALSSMGVSAAQLTLTHNLTAALQQPLVLHVVVEDTYRYADNSYLKETHHGGGGGGGSGGAPGTRASSATHGHSLKDGASTTALSSSSTAAAALAGKQLQAPALQATPLPDRHLVSALASAHRAKKEAAADVRDDAVVECQRREMGVLRLDPFDLFTAAKDCGPAFAGLGAAAQLAAPGGVASSLPNSRVLFLRDVAMEVDARALAAMQLELQQRRSQLREALLLYNATRKHSEELAAAEARSAAETPPDATASLLRAATPGARPTSSSAGHAAQSAPQRLTPTVTLIPSPPPPSTSAAVHGASQQQQQQKLPPRASRASASTQPSSQASQIHALLLEQQVAVARLAVRVMALQTRVAELSTATLSVDVRLSIGRGPAPPTTTAADAALDALRYRRDAPVVRKTRPQQGKSSRRQN